MASERGNFNVWPVMVMAMCALYIYSLPQHKSAMDFQIELNRNQIEMNKIFAPMDEAIRKSHEDFCATVLKYSKPSKEELKEWKCELTPKQKRSLTHGD